MSKELTQEERTKLKEVLDHALNAEPDSLLRAIGEQLMKLNPPITTDTKW
jgi:hypothetical protein